METRQAGTLTTVMMLRGSAKTGEPAFHIEVWTSGAGSEIALPLADENPASLSPTDADQVCIMTNPNFASVQALDGVYVKDAVDRGKEA